MSQASLRISGYFSTPQGTLFPFALSPTHFVDLPPTSVVTCISCSLCFTHSCHVWFSSYYPTLLRTGRSVPSSRPHHASGPLTHNPVTSSRGPAGHALGSRPLHGPPVTLYTTGPNHARRLMSRHPRPPSWSRRRPDWLRSHPLLGPARTRSPRRPRSPWRPATRLMAARSPHHQHACLLLHAPALTRAEVRSSLLRHARPGPTRLTTRGPPPPLSPYTHARARSLCATRGFPIAGS